MAFWGGDIQFFCCCFDRIEGSPHLLIYVDIKLESLMAQMVITVQQHDTAFLSTWWKSVFGYTLTEKQPVFCKSVSPNV